MGNFPQASFSLCVIKFWYPPLLCNVPCLFRLCLAQCGDCLFIDLRRHLADVDYLIPFQDFLQGYSRTVQFCQQDKFKLLPCTASPALCGISPGDCSFSTSLSFLPVLDSLGILDILTIWGFLGGLFFLLLFLPGISPQRSGILDALYQEWLTRDDCIFDELKAYVVGELEAIAQAGSRKDGKEAADGTGTDQAA